MVGKKVVLALAACSERTGVVMDTSDGNSFRRGSVASTAKISEMSSAPIPFQLADSLIYIQASINGSHLLWMMLDTGSSVTVFDETVSKMLGIRFLGEGNVDGPGQGSVQKLAFANHATLMFAGEELGDHLWRRCLWNGSRAKWAEVRMGSSAPMYSATMSLKLTTQTKCSGSTIRLPRTRRGTPRATGATSESRRG